VIERLALKLSPQLRTRLDDFKLLIGIADLSRSPKIAGLHLLRACLDDELGLTSQFVSSHSLPPDKVKEQLAKQFQGSSEDGPESLDEQWFDERLWKALAELDDGDAGREITEYDLLVVALSTLTDREDKRLSEWFNSDIESLIKEIRALSITTAVMEIFDKNGVINLESFSAASRRSLKLAHEEAQALGLKGITREVVLLAMLDYDGLFKTAIRTQAVDPNTVHENLLINLQSSHRAKQLLFPFDVTHCHSLLQKALQDAALASSQAGFDKVQEAHILKALLSSTYGLAIQIITELGVKLPRLFTFLDASLAWQGDGSEEDDEEARIPDIHEVEQELRETVVGQEEVIERIMPLIKRFRYGYRRVGKPGGVFLFMGKSGTGKTLMAKTIAKAVYGSSDDLLMLEMGQFKTDISINQFIGAPPGYKGYGEGKLTNGLRDNPETVVLFDEVEKASELVYDALLRFLDEGMINDPAGPVRDGSRCLIALTSNIASEELGSLAKELRESGHDFDSMQRELREAALRYFKRPELINRIDEIIMFNPLDKEDFRKILEMELRKDTAWFKQEKNVEVTVDSQLMAKLIDWAYERHDEGARVVGKVLTTNLISPLIDVLVARPDHGHVRLTAIASDHGGVEFLEDGQSD